MLRYAFFFFFFFYKRLWAPGSVPVACHSKSKTNVFFFSNYNDEFLEMLYLGDGLCSDGSGPMCKTMCGRVRTSEYTYQFYAVATQKVTLRMLHMIRLLHPVCNTQRYASFAMYAM